ncbi:restriction endonuclease [Pseudomonas sp. AF03-9]|jgi:hypothetical protein|uniref:restriction endonuclease n=1 Tax=Pseudomonas sp. AF03-9 TaxID=2849867 RepID=UPI001CF9830D|nr:restriction endonuclease [Pseudomonas sp. AF03-9]
MSSDGKRLENLVAWIESTLAPNGFEVVQNLRTRGTEVGGGEFDIVLQGRVGSLNLKWLIECRDRPSEGPAPSSWVQQLMGRKQGFGFDVVTAVSTTGFTADALAMARTFRISTRTVKGLTPEEFSSWVSAPFITSQCRRMELEGASFLLDGVSTPERQAALQSVMNSLRGDTPALKVPQTGELHAAYTAFVGAVGSNEEVFSSVEVNGPLRKVRLKAEYPEGNRYFLELQGEDVGVYAIEFRGSVGIEEVVMPLDEAAKYVDSDNGEVKSLLVTYAPHLMLGMKFQLELHNIPGRGTEILFRRVADDDPPVGS